MPSIRDFLSGAVNFIRNPLFFKPKQLRPAGIVESLERPWLEELIRTYNGPAFQRWFRGDNLTGETEEIRRAYRMALSEPTVKAALVGKILNVASLDLRVIPANKKAALDKEVAKFCENALRKCPGGVPRIVWNIASGGLLDGWSVCEPIWGLGSYGVLKDRHTLLDFKAKDTNYLRPYVDNFRNLVGLQATTFNNAQIYDPKEFVVFTYLQFFESPTGMSDLRAANRAINCKRAAIQLRMIFLDRFTGPFAKGKFKDATMRAELDAALKAAKSQGYILLDEGTDVEFLDITTRSTEDFMKAIADFDKEIVISIYGAFLHMLEGTGSNVPGNSNVQKSISELFVWYLSVLIAETINHQLIPQLVLPNYGPVDMPSVALESVNPNAVLSELQIDKLLSELGLELSKDEIYERAGRTPPEDDGDILFPRIPRWQYQEQAGTPPSGGTGFNLPSLPFSEEGQSLGKSQPASGSVALAGTDGNRVADLIRTAQSQGQRTLESIVATALGRIVEIKSIPSNFLTESEKQQLADAFAATNSVGDLLGRARIRERMQKAAIAGGMHRFAEKMPLEMFAESQSIEPLPPLEALEYFRGLVPEIAVEPALFGPLQQRRAFTLAVATDQTLLTRVQNLIADRINGGGWDAWPAPSQIEDLLDELGVTPANPQYSEMVFRTNAMDAFNIGSQLELESPDVRSFFPVWRYAGIRDGRQGADHEPHFDKYYPNSVSFATVRGPRPFNCRCSFIPVDRFEWAELQAAGAQVETTW